MVQLKTKKESKRLHQIRTYLYLTSGNVPARAWGDYINPLIKQWIYIMEQWITRDVPRFYQSHSPLSIVSECKIAKQEVSESIAWRKRHFVVLHVIRQLLLKDIVDGDTVSRQRCVGCNVSIVSPRLARAYNPRQHFYCLSEITPKLSALIEAFECKICD